MGEEEKGSDHRIKMRKREASVKEREKCVEWLCFWELREVISVNSVNQKSE